MFAKHQAIMPQTPNAWQFSGLGDGGRFLLTEQTLTQNSEAQYSDKRGSSGP